MKKIYMCNMFVKMVIPIEVDITENMTDKKLKESLTDGFHSYCDVIYDNLPVASLLWVDDNDKVLYERRERLTIPN